MSIQTQTSVPLHKKILLTGITAGSFPHYLSPANFQTIKPSICPIIGVSTGRHLQIWRHLSSSSILILISAAMPPSNHQSVIILLLTIVSAKNCSPWAIHMKMILSHYFKVKLIQKQTSRYFLLITSTLLNPYH